MKYLVVILVLVIACLLLSRWSDMRQWDKERGLYVLNDSLLQKKVLDIRDSANRHLVDYELQAITTNQLMASQNEIITQMQEDLQHVGAKLKDVKSIMSVKATTHETVIIQVDTFFRTGDTGIRRVPLVYKADEWMDVAGYSTFHLTDSGVRYDSLHLGIGVHNFTSLAIYNETKFLQRQKLKALVIQNNPHTTTGKFQTYYIEPDKKWFQKWYVHVAAGAIGALVLTSYIK